jgi:hypothetical protein
VWYRYCHEDKQFSGYNVYSMDACRCVVFSSQASCGLLACLSVGQVGNEGSLYCVVSTSVEEVSSLTHTVVKGNASLVSLKGLQCINILALYPVKETDFV